MHYDPMIAKLIAHAETRDAAIARARAALAEFDVLGLVTNIPFLLRVLDSEAFRRGELDTGFLDGEGAALGISPPLPAAAAGGGGDPRRARARDEPRVSAVSACPDPWTTHRRDGGTDMAAPGRFTVRDDATSTVVEVQADGRVRVGDSAVLTVTPLAAGAMPSSRWRGATHVARRRARPTGASCRSAARRRDVEIAARGPGATPHAAGRVRRDLGADARAP